jgi:hypothetical protein
MKLLCLIDDFCLFSGVSEPLLMGSDQTNISAPKLNWPQNSTFMVWIVNAPRIVRRSIDEHSDHFASGGGRNNPDLCLRYPVWPFKCTVLFLAPSTNRMPPRKTKMFGTREEVWRNQAQQTRYGLTKSGLCLSKKGTIVSKAKQKIAKKRSNLGKHLYSKG